MHRSLSVIVLLLVLIGAALPGPRSTLAQSQTYSDSMDSAETGLLSTETFDPSISFSYQDGLFIIAAQQPAYQGIVTSTLNVPEMANSRLTVETAIAGDLAGKYVFAGCRHNDAGQGYGFGYWPGSGELLIWRADGVEYVALAEYADPSLIPLATDTYQIGIDCAPGTITGSIDGQPLVTAQDATYATGRPTIGVGAEGQQTDGLTVEFDNLTVVDNGNQATGAVPPTVPAGESTTVPAGTTIGQSAPIRDPLVDPEGTLTDAFTISINQVPVVEGIANDFTLPLGSVTSVPSGVQLTDFYAELYYTAPTLPASTSYIVGFCFWADPAGNCYDFYLEEMGTGVPGWGYGYDAVDAEYQSLQLGDLPPGSLDPTPGANNFLSLTVYQGVAILSGNTFAADVVLPLDGTPLAGDVLAEAGFLILEESGVTTPLPLSISDFAVWDLSSGMVPVSGGASAVATEQPAVADVPTTIPPSVSVPIATEQPGVATLPTVVLPPVAAPAATEQPAVSTLPAAAPPPASAPALPPLQGSSGTDTFFDETRTAAVLNPSLVAGLSGSFVQEIGVYASVGAGVSLGDFYTIATFTNPVDGAPYDVGIGFRADQGESSGLRFVITSDGLWFMQLPGQEPYASGNATSFDLTPGASNTIEIMVQGSTGTVAVNGVLLPQFDLSTLMVRGDIYLGAGFYDGDAVDGREIPYSNWWLFPTDILDIPSG